MFLLFIDLLQRFFYIINIYKIHIHLHNTSMFKLSFFETENMRKSGGKAGEKMKRLNKAEIKLADEKFVV